MAVLRVVANIEGDPARAEAFYGGVLGMTRAMDMGWIATWTGAGGASAQLSVMTGGGSGTPVPDISVEVDDLDAVLDRARAAGLAPEYGPVDEPWGVRRFYLRDPFGRLVNVLAHAD